MGNKNKNQEASKSKTGLKLDSEAFSSDEFRIYQFKVKRCPRARPHDWTQCPFAHPGEKAARRDPRRFCYSGIACSDYRRCGECDKGNSCPYAHGVFECWLHPNRYKTQLCTDGAECKRVICFFAHAQEELRYVNDATVLPDASLMFMDESFQRQLQCAAGVPNLLANTNGFLQNEVMIDPMGFDFSSQAGISPALAMNWFQSCPQPDAVHPPLTSAAGISCMSHAVPLTDLAAASPVPAMPTPACLSSSDDSLRALRLSSGEMSYLSSVSACASQLPSTDPSPSISSSSLVFSEEDLYAHTDRNITAAAAFQAAVPAKNGGALKTVPAAHLTPANMGPNGSVASNESLLSELLSGKNVAALQNFPLKEFLMKALQTLSVSSPPPPPQPPSQPQAPQAPHPSQLAQPTPEQAVHQQKQMSQLPQQSFVQMQMQMQMGQQPPPPQQQQQLSHLQALLPSQVQPQQSSALFHNVRGASTVAGMNVNVTNNGRHGLDAPTNGSDVSRDLLLLTLGMQSNGGNANEFNGAHGAHDMNSIAPFANNLRASHTLPTSATPFPMASLSAPQLNLIGASSGPPSHCVASSRHSSNPQLILEELRGDFGGLNSPISQQVHNSPERLSYGQVHIPNPLSRTLTAPGGSISSIPASELDLMRSFAFLSSTAGAMNAPGVAAGATTLGY